MNSSPLAYAALVPLFLAGPARSAPDAGQWEFGFHRIGKAFGEAPPSIRSKRDCGEREGIFSCEVLLGDGVWYRFDNRRIVSKAIYLPSRSLPSWISPAEGPRGCKARLERLTARKFRMWTDDAGVTLVETIGLLKPRNGTPFSISVAFRNGRMIDIVESQMPHADA